MERARLAVDLEVAPRPLPPSSGTAAAAEAQSQRGLLEREKLKRGNFPTH